MHQLLFSACTVLIAPLSSILALTTGLDVQVESMVLYGGLARLNKNGLSVLRMIVQLSSANLTSLYLAELTLDQFYSDLGMRPGSASSTLKVLAGIQR